MNKKCKFFLLHCNLREENAVKLTSLTSGLNILIDISKDLVSVLLEFHWKKNLITLNQAGQLKFFPVEVSDIFFHTIRQHRQWAVGLET